MSLSISGAAALRQATARLTGGGEKPARPAPAARRDALPVSLSASGSGGHDEAVIRGVHLTSSGAATRPGNSAYGLSHSALASRVARAHTATASSTLAAFDPHRQVPTRPAPSAPREATEGRTRTPRPIPSTPQPTAAPARTVAAPPTQTAAPTQTTAPSTQPAPTSATAPVAPVTSTAPTVKPMVFAIDESSLTASNLIGTSPDEVRKAIGAAIQEINRAAGQVLIDPNVGTTSTHSPANDGVNTITFAPSGYSFGSSTVAVTGVSSDSSGKILDADLMFNPAMRFSTASSGSVEQTTFDVQGIAMHELMHALGVQHIADPSSTMNASTSMTGDLQMRTLESSDVNALTALYPTVA